MSDDMDFSALDDLAASMANLLEDMNDIFIPSNEDIKQDDKLDIAPTVVSSETPPALPLKKKATQQSLGLSMDPSNLTTSPGTTTTTTTTINDESPPALPPKKKTLATPQREEPFYVNATESTSSKTSPKTSALPVAIVEQREQINSPLLTQQMEFSFVDTSAVQQQKPPALPPKAKNSSMSPQNVHATEPLYVNVPDDRTSPTAIESGRSSVAGTIAYSRKPFPTPSPGSTRPSSTMVIDCLLPTGHIILLQCSRDSSFAEIKEDLWKHATTQSLLAARLKKHELYVFSYVNADGEVEELMDENMTINEVRFFKKFLRVVERRGNKAEKFLNAQIGNIIGKTLYVYNLMKDPEIDDFRCRILSTCKEIVEDRWGDILAGNDLYGFASEITSSEVPNSVKAKITAKGTFLVNMFALDAADSSSKFTFSVEQGQTPASLVAMTIKKMKTSLRIEEELQEDRFVIKICGRHQYLFGEHRIVDFKCMREALLAGGAVNCILVPKARLREWAPAETELPCWISQYNADVTDYMVKSQAQVYGNTLWDLTERFRIKIVGAKNVSAGDVDGMYWKVGIYHGGKMIAPMLKTRTVGNSAEPAWDEDLTFDIMLKHVPRGARLCFTLYGMWQVSEKSSGSSAKKSGAVPRKHDITRNAHGVGIKEERSAIGWVNMPVFDYNSTLRRGTIILSTWPCDPNDPKAGGNPIGTTVSNPDKSFGGGAIHLSVDLGSRDHAIVFPMQPMDIDYTQVQGPEPQQKEAKRIRLLIEKDPLAKISTKDKALLWKYRFSYMKEPRYLPKLLLAVPWNNKDIVREVQALLQLWSPLTPQDALELLDSNFASPNVRSFAVKCLEPISDEQKLCEYLPQLVQVLKYESYLDCDLARFLLRRALINQKIGHFFFWLLRAEMHIADVVVRYGLLLEAYCKGCGNHMRLLHNQIEAMAKLVDVANKIKPKELKTKEMKMAVLRESLSKLKLPPFQLPHDPSIVVQNLRVDKCKFMDSKKLPLWLVFENYDPTGKDIYIIFKAGDDLRQDMLTLQLLSIMDNLWKKEGINLEMLPYGCISTGDEVGMIEVVLNSNTICNIQKEKGGGVKGALKDDPLQKWLAAHNADAQLYDAAVERFTLSCAGYCVATYVLGIGDRHNDNIMMKESGQLFHIDFGHFLGNFKSKFGVKRERVPFVLTPDFVYVMAGKEGTDSIQFRKFKTICKQVYLILRRHANLFINLFAMMLSTGIPQLREPDDINYIREALCIGLSDEDAALHFEKELETALAKSWSTRVNWYIHSAVH